MKTVLLTLSLLLSIMLAGCVETPANQNLAASLAFLQKNSATPDIHQTASGLQYLVLKEGTGAKPIFLDTVNVYYRGYLPDNTTFDATPTNQPPARFALSRVIAGWQEGIALMSEGAKYRFFIHPSLAYGAAGSPPKIGPNQLLIFDVELVRVDKYRPN